MSENENFTSARRIHETIGGMAISPGGPEWHAACDAEIARMRERAERAEAKLAAIAELCQKPSLCSCGLGYRPADILAITSSEEEAGHG